MLYLGLRLVESGSGYRICWIRIKSGSGFRPRFLKFFLQIFTFENKFGEKRHLCVFLQLLKITFMLLEKSQAPQDSSNFFFFAIGTNLAHLVPDVDPTPNPDPDPQI
jgi:hypothetical protein